MSNRPFFNFSAFVSPSGVSSFNFAWVEITPSPSHWRQNETESPLDRVGISLTDGEIKAVGSTNHEVCNDSEVGKSKDKSSTIFESMILIGKVVTSGPELLFPATRTILQTTIKVEMGNLLHDWRI
jgi:hypothetical protein